MEDQELRNIIREEMEGAPIHVQDVVRTAVRETLVTLGMDASDPMALQQDMHYLREWRETHERLKSKGMLIALGLLVTGGLGALWLGVKSLFQN